MTTETLTLSDFLLARLAEDEAWCRYFDGELVDRPEVGEPVYQVPARGLADVEAKRRIVEMHEPTRGIDMNTSVPYGVGHPDHAGFGHGWGDVCDVCSSESEGDPVGKFPCDTLMLLAQPYADHPDFREEWRA